MDTPDVPSKKASKEQKRKVDTPDAPSKKIKLMQSKKRYYYKMFTELHVLTQLPDLKFKPEKLMPWRKNCFLIVERLLSKQWTGCKSTRNIK